MDDSSRWGTVEDWLSDNWTAANWNAWFRDLSSLMEKENRSRGQLWLEGYGAIGGKILKT